ncbi:hypothetical protein [Companilactobacillus futsaii]|uniref:Uncharacterized protein n=2 Tax=Companilactobacillus futsaii TaxID=938155 RepID=A0A5B7SWI3_9LACO|nr:hypothetical protein [Companilactobacillus futsaii]KRK93573.1 hypothetical protein FC88_GL000281 [Companilactobacillus futsaii JCM 17355]QCX24276.1 hypothetical protein FG051_03760 [Companilactobacillus futsaii]
MKMYKTISIGFVVLTALSVSAPSITTEVRAAKVDDTVVQGETDEFKGLTDQELKDLGFNNQEINNYNNNINDNLIIDHGMVINGQGDGISRGKFTWAVKVIRKGYSKLPSSVKKYIAAHTGLDTLLDFVENATGTLQDAIYKACRNVGMNATIANIVTAAIMTLVF